MKIIVVGHGMVGHKFLEELHQQKLASADVTVLGEEPRPAYDRVHLSEFFAGKSAEDLSLVAPGFFEQSGFSLRLKARASASFCFSPPESTCADWPSNAPNPTCPALSAARARACARGTPSRING